MSVATFTKSGAKASTAAKLDKSVFGIEVNNHELVKAAYEMHRANGRVNLATTKTRGKVRGGGRKPWRQKGTGRARFGSIRVPIWRGGGITFGPLGEENYSKNMNKKARKLAIRQALSLKASNVIVVESLDSKGKTSELAKLLKKIDAERKSLLVNLEVNQLLENAARNIPDVEIVAPMYLNVFDIMNADHIILTRDSLAAVQQWLGDTK
ncbi:MAG: 50S ribosomal protein L4 [Patescibacteria group bacterium]